MRTLMMVASCLGAMIASTAFADDAMERLQSTMEQVCAQPASSAPPALDATMLYALTDCQKGKKPNFMMGTLHSSDAGIIKSIEFIVPYLEASDATWFEILEDGHSAQQVIRLMFLPMEDKAGLKGLLGEKDFAQFVALMQNESPTFSEYHLTRYRPWAAAIMLQLLAIDTSGVVMDDWMQNQARNSEKPIHALETIQEQFAMFDALSVNEQLIMLRDAMTQFDDQKRFTKEMMDAYRQGNLQNVAAIAQKVMDALPDKNLAAKLKNEIVTVRNMRMRDKMRQDFKKGGQFVAVGALHLPYAEGLLAHAQRDGYRIIPIAKP
ncbi:MAG: TraB/GumN family protein [Alphaproteobacteria bacterium]|nr:MAG: TraB/GumN family protein [Alphaproteobacteria bacterium]